MRRSSSPVRFPFVLSSSIAMRSIVWRASGRLFSTCPVSGLGASPRATSAEWLNDRMNVAKSTCGNASACPSEWVLASTITCLRWLRASYRRRPPRASSVFAPAERRLREHDGLGLLAHVGQGRDVLLDVLLVEDALAQVALADAHVPLPRV